ncbi:MAG: urate hydroxylase PuuD [Woeseiaceae bacterium]|nr:urate hydroxylase PuuD [Woeseiaceae bacterium]
MNPLKSIVGTIVSGFVLAIIIVLVTKGNHMVAGMSAQSITIWLHVLFGITWIGLLYYFNFVQVPALGEAAGDEGGPGPAGISKYVAPRALAWFRWGALGTWLTGAAFLLHKKQLLNAFMLGMNTDPINQYALTIGVGAWLGTFMLFNVWVLIWPNQKKVLGMVEASADEVAKAKNVAFLASRSNTLMSIPMIMSMVGAGHGWFM